MAFLRITIFFMACCVLVAQLAWADPNKDSVFETLAPQAIIMDYETGVVLYEKNARKAVPPASMTKIMTAELVFDRIREGALSKDTLFSVSEEAWRRGGSASGSSTMFLDVNSKVRVEDLLRGVIIQSGNDACIVLAEGIAGSETAFADMMTRHAQKIGLTSANFKNATGWPDPEHRINLFDLAQLARRTISDYSEFYSIYSERSFTWNGIEQGNRNPLLGRFTGADGLKTGHTEASGYGLVASAKRGDTRRIVVVNGLDSQAQRRDESLRLMQAAFDQFKVYTLFSAGDEAAQLDTFMGKAPHISIAPEQDVLIGLHRGARKDLNIVIEHKTEYPAPIKKGDHLADLIVTAPGLNSQKIQLYAIDYVAQKSSFGRVVSVLKRKMRAE